MGMRFTIVFALFFVFSTAKAQTSIFAQGADSSAVFEQLDMQFGASLDTVVVVRFQLNEEGMADQGEVVRVYCKSCAEKAVKRVKKQALQVAKKMDKKSVETTSNMGKYYLVPVTISGKKQAQKEKPTK